MPFLRTALLTVTGLVFPEGTVSGSESPDNPLEADRWAHRPLIAVADSEADPGYRDLLSRVDARREAFEARDMILYTVTDEGVIRGGETLARGPAERVRSVVGADRIHGATLILVGKDGGEKMRVPASTSLDAVFAHIDRMPMRRREMRGEGQDGGADGR